MPGPGFRFDVCRPWRQRPPSDVEYGTPATARAVRHLLQATNLRKMTVFAMAGHRAGVVAFGKNLSEAYASLLEAMPPEASA